jgi:hypothetical protein
MKRTMKPLLATSSLTDIAMIKSLFEGEGISHYVTNEKFISMVGGGPSCEVLVRTDQYGLAKSSSAAST